MAAKLTRLTHKIAIQLRLVAERCNICSSRSRRPVRKLLDTPSYICANCEQVDSCCIPVQLDTTQFCLLISKRTGQYSKLASRNTKKLNHALLENVSFFYLLPCTQYKLYCVVPEFITDSLNNSC
jgi:hypothetical protein